MIRNRLTMHWTRICAWVVRMAEGQKVGLMPGVRVVHTYVDGQEGGLLLGDPQISPVCIQNETIIQKIDNSDGMWTYAERPNRQHG